jgi:glutamyl-Q tRNA(Asp) synthetase
MARFLTRFAPSPTGRLHLGHAFSARECFRAAQAAGGVCLLRMEDIDLIRCTPEFDAGVIEDLSWLGFSWPEPARRQSRHISEYEGVIAQLAAAGLVYRCFKTRREIAEDIARAPHQPGEGPDGAIYPGPSEPMSADEEAERLSRGEPFSWRLSIARCREHLGAAYDRLVVIEEGEGPQGETGEVRARPERLGDVILARKDVPASYHVANTHDDALQGVTHVIRGHDLFFVSQLHVLLRTLMGWPQPVHRHHRLITGPDGRRLSKRDKSLTLQAMREAGLSPADIWARAEAG